MIIKKIRLKNFRNYIDYEIDPYEKINIIYGQNAMGKTNLIEAIYMIINAKSFKSQDEKIINFDNTFSNIYAKVFINDFLDEKEIILEKNVNKILLLNEKRVTRANFKKNNSVILFSPIDLNIIKLSPQDRRRFLDEIISSIDPIYEYHINRYKKILEQRNRLLKNYMIDDILLNIYDVELSKTGAKIIVLRLKNIKKLNILANIHYKKLSEVDYLKTEYLSTFPLMDTENHIAKNFYIQLKKNFLLDKKKKFTSVGPHRDDIEFLINNRSAKIYGSQGEQRSVILSLKLAQKDLLVKEINKRPILILDDVFSELDERRRRYLLESLDDMQSFITTTEINDYLKDLDYKSFNIENKNL